MDHYGPDGYGPDGPFEVVAEDADDDNDRESYTSDRAPQHPVSALQDAFEESIREATEADGEFEEEQAAKPNAEARRRGLIDQETYDESWTSRWKQKPTATWHPLVKLMAQIIFGLHLLYQQQAKSDAEVVKILQTHVDEIDAFLERTTEDFDLAQKDVDERIGHLKLPMSHLEVFDVMLDDRRFRTQLMEGNDKIEIIVERTAKSMNAALYDIQKGVNSTQQLAEYLDVVQETWPHSSQEQTAILVAMRGNEEGWRACLRELQSKGNKLGVSLVQLGTVVGEMSKLAAAASRRDRSKFRAARAAGGERTAPRSKYASRENSHPSSPHSNSPNRQRNDSMDANKPLPRDPDAVGAALKATIPRERPTLLDSRFERPRETPPVPRSASRKQTTSPLPPPVPPSRPTKIMSPREPCSPTKSQTNELAGFIKHTSPMQISAPVNLGPLGYGQPRSPRDHKMIHSRGPSDRTPPVTQKPKIRHVRTPSEDAPQPVGLGRSMSLMDRFGRSNGTSSNGYQHPAALARTESRLGQTSAMDFRSPSRLGVLPEPSPSTPQFSRTTSMSLRSPAYVTSSAGYVQDDYARPRTSPFSIKKMFGRKQKDLPVYV